VRAPPGENIALSQGERVASGASQVRGCFVTFPYLVPLLAQPTPHPSRPSADGLVKTPVGGHPLPEGEGCDPVWFCRQPSPRGVPDEGGRVRGHSATFGAGPTQAAFD